jgi:riboflavin biosynthesis pyrimidine reductase
MHRLLPHPSAVLDQDDLAEHYAYPPQGAVRANMVGSIDGAVAVVGRSSGLSGEADRTVFRVLRALADVVLVGAGTARSEDYGPAVTHPGLEHLRKGRPAAPRIAVVTNTAALDPAARLFADQSSRPLVITCESAPGDRVAALGRVADVVQAGEDQVDVTRALAHLAGLGWSRVLAEGGPTLLGAVLLKDALDELALTVAPLVVGSDAGRIVDSPPIDPRRFRLHGLLEADDFLFARYTRRDA